MLLNNLNDEQDCQRALVSLIYVGDVIVDKLPAKKLPA